MTSIGALIKATRERRGWSQSRLAIALNDVSGHATLDGQYISRWERGARTPDDFWLRHLARVLSSDLGQLDRAAAHLAGAKLASKLGDRPGWLPTAAYAWPPKPHAQA